MKIAFYLSGHLPETGGGFTFESEVFDSLLRQSTGNAHDLCIFAEVQLADVARHRTSSTGLDVVTVKPSRLQTLSNALKRRFPMLHEIWRGPSLLDRLAVQNGVDLVWFATPVFAPQPIDWPYITTMWDVQHRVTPWFPELAGNTIWDQRERAYTRFLQRASAVITGTSTGKEEIERYYQVTPERIALLPHPTPQFALAQASTRLALPSGFGLDRSYMLYPAQFWPHKNHANLLLAMTHLRDSGVQPPLLALVGSDKGNRAFVEKMAAELGLSAFLRVLGFVSREELIALYQNARMLVYPSWFGPENLPPLEAFALGCPVAAARVPGSPEQLGDAALLFEPGDPGDIAGAIARLDGDEALRARLIEAGHARARSWTADDYVRGALALAEKLAPMLRSWSRAAT